MNYVLYQSFVSVCSVCSVSEYHFLTLAYAVAGCVSISAFAFLVGIPLEITSSAIDIKSCAITTGIKMYKSIIKKKKLDKTVLLAKLKVNSIQVFISKTLTHSNIRHDKFV